MRIAFTGVGGCGKTTLAKWLAAERGWPLVPIGARSTAVAMGFVGSNGEGRPFDVDRAYEHGYLDGLALDNRMSSTAELKDAPVEVRAAAYAKDCMSWGRGPSMHRAESSGMRTCRSLFQQRLQADKLAWEAAHEDFITDRTPLDDAAYAFLHCPQIVDRAFLERAMAGMRRYHYVFFCPLSAGQWLDGDPAREGDEAYYLRLELALRGLRDACFPLLNATDHVELSRGDLGVRKEQVWRWTSAPPA